MFLVAEPQNTFQSLLFFEVGVSGFYCSSKGNRQFSYLFQRQQKSNQGFRDDEVRVGEKGEWPIPCTASQAPPHVPEESVATGKEIRPQVIRLPSLYYRPESALEWRKNKNNEQQIPLPGPSPLIQPPSSATMLSCARAPASPRMRTQVHALRPASAGRPSSASPWRRLDTGRRSQCRVCSEKLLSRNLGEWKIIRSVRLTR